jgi:hypothetical protein
MPENYSKIKFKKVAGGFQHNLKVDYACFALWKSARPYKEKIRELITDQFDILLEAEIIWSQEHFHENAARLYEAPMYKDIAKEKRRSNHAEKIGDNRFILFVIKDTAPHYTFAKSVSGKIELSNLNVVNAKYKFRDWIKEDIGVKYGVHSTNNIHEFFFQAPLLLGVELFDKLLNGKNPATKVINKDLEGADGWKNYTDFFRILNLTSNYLVQRSFETLPYANEEKDIDLLTDNYQRLASAIGARQFRKQPYKGYVTINGERISLDIRFIGDKYYDIVWQKGMLDNKICKNGVFVPREDDYFFSLLFHCKVQKGHVKEKYIGILSEIAKKHDFNWYNTELLADNTKIAEILRGYFQSHGYYYEDPLDNGVFKNNEIIRHLPKSEKIFNSRKSKKQKIKSLIKKGIPKSLHPFFKKLIRK